MSSTSEVAIRSESLAVGWGGAPILEHLDFEVRRGEVFVILGGSGCGKSTLLRHLIGLESPMSGRIWVEGIGEPSLAASRPRAGVMFQAGALFGSMTLVENVSLPLETWTDLDAEAIDVVARSRLRIVGLQGFEDYLPAEISGGMRKRAAIARALALEPPLLYLDEPAAGLDPISAVELDELIVTLNRSLGMTMVIVSHELESIFKVADRCIMLDREARSSIALGDPRELRQGSDDPRVRAFLNRLPRGTP